jgi:large subunit ribosomal protein L22
MTTVKAQLNGLRISPRKVRLVAGLLKRRTVAAALDQVAHMPKRSALPLKKLIESAAANAHNNFKLDRDHLFIIDFRVDEGIKLRRFRPKGFGRANPIEKKTSRVTVVLEDRAPKQESGKATSKHDDNSGRKPKA